MSYFAVIDTETNWADQVMSIGTVIAHTQTLEVLDARYHVLPEECQVGGMYENTLFIETPVQPILCTRHKAIQELLLLFSHLGVEKIFAYNAGFDRNHLPELRAFAWYDIMRLAAYRQYNPCILADADCYSTGRLKRGYGVEAMLRLLCGSRGYCETHNAIHDAFDELKIIKLLGHPLDAYIPL